MKDWKLLFANRIWGLSMGIFFGSLFVDKPIWLSIIIATPCLYFMFFGDTHFRKE